MIALVGVLESSGQSDVMNLRRRLGFSGSGCSRERAPAYGKEGADKKEKNPFFQVGLGGYGRPLLSAWTTVPVPLTGEPSSTRIIVRVRRQCCSRISPKHSFPNLGMMKQCPLRSTPGPVAFIFFWSTIEQRSAPCCGCSGSFSPVSNGSSAIFLKSRLLLNSFFSPAYLSIFSKSSS